MSDFDNSERIQFPQVGPFKVYEYDEYFVLYISDEFADTPVNYRDDTGKNFWREIEREILEVHPLKETHFGLISIEHDDSLDIIIRVRKIPLEKVSERLSCYSKWRIPTLKRIIINQLDDHIEGIRMFIKYCDKYGIEEAENMLYLYKNIR